MPLLILAATSLIYYAVQKAKELSPEALSSQVLLFVLWNINILLIIGILFVLLRGVVKLVLERQRGIIGSRFRTKLVVTYVATSLMPVLILLFLRHRSAAHLDRPLVQHAGAHDPARTAKRSRRWRRTSRRRWPRRPRARSPRRRRADPAQLDAVLSHVQQFHSVDMVGLYRDGTLVKRGRQSARADS